MKKEFFVVGDVHGKFELLLDILKKWNEERQQLIFLGDLIDRGENSKACLELVRQLVREKGAICLTGNHERMFLAWLRDPVDRYDHYRRNGGDTTINSLLGRPLDAPVDGLVDANAVMEQYEDLIDFVKSCPYHMETERYIFVHAGVDLTLPDWRETNNHDKVWLRALFHEADNTTGKMIVFGHTPVYNLYQTKLRISQIWTSLDGKMGIDGGAVYGGVLHGIVLDDTGLVQDYIVGAVNPRKEIED
ncbi:TPA: metallophosphoesterase [Streptococcus suis]|uniref:Serine/threonine protein phosphatase n=1 Tax=Streptococcus suis TaxID=1307 RepID=A0A3R8N5L2_STRSU|nr:metallophosphoesterase [Streptococcus suis]RRN50015.1 serine/threonine protein phosphatase [Streptococcus suis]